MTLRIYIERSEVYFRLLMRMSTCIFLFFLLSVTVFARGKKKLVETQPSVGELVSAIHEDAPALWLKGKPFVCLEGQASRVLMPEDVSSADSLCFLPGSVWHFDSMVSEEDWMGRQLLQLRFVSPDGRYYRFETGRTMDAMSDTTYHPVMDGIYPLEILQRIDSVFHARTLYININDERVTYSAGCLSDSAFVPMKFVPVLVDSVSAGNVVGPLKVWFSSAEMSGSFLTSLPDSRESLTTTPIHRFLSVNNLRAEYPNISDENWSRLQRSEFVIDMTMEEVRLAIGRPLRFERITARIGLIERWYYPHSRVLEFLDGRLSRVGRSLTE